MRLQKQLSRKYGSKEYSKYVLVLKEKIVNDLGWLDGDDLQTEVKNKELIIKKSKKTK